MSMIQKLPVIDKKKLSVKEENIQVIEQKMQDNHTKITSLRLPDIEKNRPNMQVNDQKNASQRSKNCKSSLKN